MKVLMVNDHFHFGGGGDAVFRLEREAYESRGIEVFTFTHGGSCESRNPRRDFVSSGPASRLFAKVGKFLWSPGIAGDFRKTLGEVRPDLVSVHLLSRYPLAFYKALRDIPVIQTLHGPNLFCATSWGCLPSGQDCDLGIGKKCFARGCLTRSEAYLYRGLDMRLQRDVKAAVDLYVCPSQHICRSAENLGYGPTEYIPLGIDERFVNVTPSDHSGDPVVLSVGALSKQKGLDYLIKAFPMVLKMCPKAKLVIAGRGREEASLRMLVQKCGIRHAVDFLGFVERDKIIDVYKGASVFVMPSIWKEQFGLVGPEALACGIPCVGSQIGGIPEWLHHGKWGYTVPPRDSVKLAESISLLLSDRLLRQTMGGKGRVWAQAEYCPSRYRERRVEIATTISAAKCGK